VHPSALAFCAVALTEDEVKDRMVLEAGALDVNGSARPHVEAFGPAVYVGTDMRAGPRVDVVCRAEDLPLQFIPGSADVVISTEMLEHAQDWQAALTGLIGVLAEGGVLVLTTRGPGFPIHGYPEDHWRFPVSSMRRILEAAALDVIVCIPDDDPASPGVFAKAVKPDGWEWPLAATRDWDGIDVHEVTG
jgi:SAM-dependent methyltransferase